MLGRKPSTFTLNEYQNWTRLTAQYDKLSYYQVFGLIGEAGEFVQALYHGPQERVIKEAGDVLWYISRGADDIGIKLQDCFDCPVQTEMFGGAIDMFLGEVCVLAELAKRVIREGTFDKGKWWHQYNRIAHCYEMLTRSRSLDIHEIIGTNVFKLEDRIDRGVLKGSGDDR